MPDAKITPVVWFIVTELIDIVEDALSTADNLENPCFQDELKRVRKLKGEAKEFLELASRPFEL